MSVALGNGATAARVSLEDKILVRIQVPQLNSLARGSFVWSGSDPPVVGVGGVLLLPIRGFGCMLDVSEFDNW
jgi:hypothetical protein